MLTGFYPKGYCKMAFAYPWWTDEKNVECSFQKVPARKLTNQLIVKLGLVSKVKLLQAVNPWGIRLLDSEVEVVNGPVGDLLLRRGVEIFLIIHIPLEGF
jgi:hypothetical protein